MKHNHLNWNLQFFSDNAETTLEQTDTDQTSTGQDEAGQGGAVLDTSATDALTKVIGELTAQNKELIKQLTEVKAANLKLAAAMPGGDNKPKSFEDNLRAIFDYGQKGDSNGGSTT